MAVPSWRRDARTFAEVVRGEDWDLWRSEPDVVASNRWNYYDATRWAPSANDWAQEQTARKAPAPPRLPGPLIVEGQGRKKEGDGRIMLLWPETWFGVGRTSTSDYLGRMEQLYKGRS